MATNRSDAIGAGEANTSLNQLLLDIASCSVCAPSLAHAPRPVVQLGGTSPIVIIGQAPGRRVHETGIAWNDPSGDRLRVWLGLDSVDFYDPEVVTIMPMGFCFPGTGPSGDLPPRTECAPLWHEKVLSHLPSERLEIIIGAYAQDRYIADRPKTVTETVAKWREYLPRQIVLPHPSPRNRHWLKKNPWFETDTVPAVRARVNEVLGR